MCEGSFQSTHPARGCDAHLLHSDRSAEIISIHAPRKGVRLSSFRLLCYGFNFNPRTPQGGATRCPEAFVTRCSFQSTHPARGCDALTENNFLSFCYFNPRTPQGGATSGITINQVLITISIHAPRKGVRLMADQLMAEADEFQSTHPARGCDARLMRLSLFKKHFNPRTPQGGATERICRRCRSWIISIHAPRKGVRREASEDAAANAEFQSTHPARGCDPHIERRLASLAAFQSTHPARGCDAPNVDSGVHAAISIHAPRKGVRQQNCVKIDTIAQFRELSGNDTSRNLRFCSL